MSHQSPSSDIRLLSSMATRRVLAELTKRFEAAHSPWRVALESVGGIDAASRVKAGEACDVVVLARESIDALIAAGHVLDGTRTDPVASPVAVRTGAAHPDISSVDGVKRAVLAAHRVGYTTGPDGISRSCSRVGMTLVQ